MKDDLINKENLSQELLQSLFEQAFLDVRLNEDGDLYIQDRWKVWIDIDESGRYIAYRMYFALTEESTPEDRLDYVNSMNNDFILIKTVAHKDYVSFSYFLWVEGGVTTKNIIMAFRIFLSVVEQALAEDKKGIFG